MSKERMLEKLKSVEISIQKIKENRPENFQDFEKSGIVKDGIYKNLEEAIQNILDVCALLVRENNLGIPSDEKSITDLLHKNSLINKKTKSLIDSFRGLRNRLVHRYGTIDDKIIFENISENLEEFDMLVEELRKLVRKL